MDDLPLLLLVEDEPLIRTALASALEDAGYRLVETDNAAEAIKAIESGEILAGIITDIQLGSGATGWDVGRHARHHFPKTAIVYMTGDSAADWTAEGVPNSVLLQKPFATAQIITAVSTLLNVADVSPARVIPSQE
jgi:CheY-like chemotaxis protein